MCGGTHPRHHVVVENVGVGGFSPTDAALSEIPAQQISLHKGVQQGGGGVRRQLAFGARTQ